MQMPGSCWRLFTKQVQPIMHKRKWIVPLLCEFCSRNHESVTNCGACDQWRYSHGAAIASRGPHEETWDLINLLINP
ncbi:unnamed protein product [Calypogeia fissa]